MHNVFLYFTAPAVIVAKTPEYSAILGSESILSCDIVDRGVPPAKFGWKKDGRELNNDYPVTVNESSITLTLTNLKIENAGQYFCTASGVLSYRTDFVELTVEGKK